MSFSIESVFLNETLGLRSGWRFVLYAAVFVVILSATGIVLSTVVGNAPLDGLTVLWLNAAVLAVPAVLTLVFMVRFVDHVPVLAFGVGFHERWPRDLGLGVALAGLMLGAFVGIHALTGQLGVRASGEPPAAAIAIMLALLLPAANEELIFRGYPLQVLMKGIGPWPAMIFMSALFGLGHHVNPNATWLGTANTFLAGILLCLAYVRTRSLWFPYGIHIGWNLGLGPILGFPLSGIELSSVWVSEAGGPDWMTGGAYGPEAGLLVTGVMCAALVAVAATRRMGVSPSVDALLARHADRVYRRESARGG